MIVNPNEFQAMIMSCDKKENKFDVDINYSTILSVDYVTLLSKKCDKEKVKKKNVNFNTFVYSHYMHCALA